MLNSEKRKELALKEQKLKDRCRDNLKNKQSFKWVWLHIKQTTQKVGSLVK